MLAGEAGLGRHFTVACELTLECGAVSAPRCDDDCAG